MGNALRRPHADYLRDGIYELRFRVNTVQYRLLYFFFDQNAACISHGITKEDDIEDRDIDFAINCKNLVRLNPDKYTEELEA